MPEGSKRERQLVCEKFVTQNCKVVRPTRRPSLPHEMFLVLISVRGSVDCRDTEGLEGLMH